MLLDGKADLSLQDDKGSSPIHFAAARGHYEAVRLLIERGANINSAEGFANVAVDLSHEAIVKILIENGANRSYRDPDHAASALHLAAKASNVEITLALIDEGWAVNAVNNYRITRYCIQWHIGGTMPACKSCSTLGLIRKYERPREQRHSILLCLRVTRNPWHCSSIIVQTYQACNTQGLTARKLWEFCLRVGRTRTALAKDGSRPIDLAEAGGHETVCGTTYWKLLGSC
jgi:Ankyrin repeats (many copies)